MKLSTPVDLPDSKAEFSYQTRFVCLGSCFATEIGLRLERSLFHCLTNPLGNLFNPLAIRETIERAIRNEPFKANEFFEYQELWRHYIVHSSLAQTSKEESLEIANKALESLSHELRRCDFLIITLGSAWIYEKPSYAGAIGHNHKLPLAEFQKRMLSPAEISKSLDESIKSLRKLRPQLQVCITVSPVRHSREGLHANNLSKSSLLLAIQAIRESFDFLSYFPAYEILLDELRDYRFYAEDLVHPSPQAIEYIWDKFCETFICDSAKIRIEEVDRIRGMLDHRTQHADTKSYQTFKSALEKRINALSQHIPRAELLKESWNELP